MQFQQLGGAQSIRHEEDVLIIETEGAVARVWVYSPSVIRVNVSRDFDRADHSFAVIQRPLSNISYTDETPDCYEVVTADLKLSVNKSPLRFSFYTPGGKLLNADDQRFGINWQGDRVVNYKTLHPDEQFIGLGEKTGPLNKRGCSYVNWNTDAALHDTKTDPLYKTFPFYVGIRDGLTYGLFFDNTHRSFFDFGASTDETMMWFGADGGDMNYYFFGAQGVAKIMEDYTWLTGRMEMPPLWSLGYQQCRWSYMSAAEVLDTAVRFRKEEIPADVMYCDIDYMDGFKIFTWNKETFPDPESFIRKLKEMGFRLVTIVDPGIKIEEGYKEYDEGVANGYFAVYPNGEKYTGSVWPGRCHFPDFFRDEVREWWGRSFKALTDPGVEGFWNDMNEPAAWGQNIPWMMKFGSRFMPEVRNAYGMQMARATYEGTRRLLNNQRPFVLTRAAYAGTQRYSAVWTGDNSAYDDHMLMGQRMVSSLGITGMSFTGVDIGGFSGNPTPELMVRWNSLGVYTPMFRNHAMQGTVMREPWQWGADNTAVIKKDIEQRYRLLPYIYSGFYQSHRTGLPLSRTLAIDYTHDRLVYDEKYHNQFLFGDSLLVAPVESTRLTAEVYLPDGEWYRLGTDEKFIGGDVYTVDAPLTDLPVFVKAGAIIPMQSTVQHTGEAGDNILELNVWNGNLPNSLIYYEDDGLSYDYQAGGYYLRRIAFDPDKRTIRLEKPEGVFRSRFKRLKLVLHGFEKIEFKHGKDNASAPGHTVLFNNDDEDIEITF
ncbi:MAG TPA: glycoside hydrolase family 31 protein [Mucilaginibacter sp.]|nr:glycoside hydrolase family 31 protein [Mucilaginibacter sp.]